MPNKPGLIVRGIDRSDDYRVVCQGCHRDFGGTFAAIPGHNIHYIVCQPCQHGSPENALKAHKARLKELHDDSISERTA